MAYSAVNVSGAGIGFQFGEQDINNKRAYNGLLLNSVVVNYRVLRAESDASLEEEEFSEATSMWNRVY